MELVMSQSNYDPSYSILRQAFEQAKPEIDAVPDGELITVTTDVVAAATTGQGVYPEVVTLRPMIVQELSSFKISRLDNLKTYALALLYANGEYKTATEPPAIVADMAETATHTRAVLLADTNSLIAHGVLAPGVINNLQGVNGYKNVMGDLIALVAIHRKYADQIADRTSLKPEELKAAEDLAAKFSEAVGLREQTPQTIAAATRVRQAAFTLFVTSYNEVRAAVQYLRRREDDADTIIPSLFAIHGTRKKPAVDTNDKPNSPAPVPVVNPPAPAQPGNNGAPAAKVTSSEHGPFVSGT
jgi:hypothetical protein